MKWALFWTAVDPIPISGSAIPHKSQRSQARKPFAAPPRQPSWFLRWNYQFLASWSSVVPIHTKKNNKMNKSFPLRRLGKHQLMRDLSRNGSLRSDENRQGIDALGHLFFRFVFFFLSVVCPFSWLFAAFWSWKLLFQLSLQHFGVGTYHFPQNLQHFGGISNILELEAAVSTVFAAFFEFEPFIFDGICNILLIELFM